MLGILKKSKTKTFCIFSNFVLNIDELKQVKIIYSSRNIALKKDTRWNKFTFCPTYVCP